MRVKRSRRALVAMAMMVAGITVPVMSADPAAALPPLTPATPPQPVAPPDIVRPITTSGPTEITAHITEDAVWGPQGSPYVVRGDIMVASSASLTLLPGTVVKLSTGSFRVTGQLLALGRPGHTIIFTSLKDDSVLGDTNGDGSASSPTPGDWRNLHFDGSHSGGAGLGPANVLDHVEVRYGGAGATGCRPGMLNVENARIRLVVSNSTFTSSASTLYTDNTSGGRFVGLYGNTFVNGGGAGCGIEWKGTGEVIGNRFVDIPFFAFPEKLRLWRNHFGAHVSLWSTSVANARANGDIRYNSFLVSLDDYSGFDLRSNWWGHDANTFPRCGIYPNNSWFPKLEVRLDSANVCPDHDFYTHGYTMDVLPALSSPPSLNPPSAVRELTAPRLGPVNLVTGAVTYEETDFGVEDAGKRLTAKRTFRSDKLSGGDAGTGWTGSYAEGLSADGSGGKLLALSDGDSLPFGSDIAAGYIPAPGVVADYTTSANGSAITTGDDVTYEFDPAGELSALVLGDPGHRVDVQRSGGKVSRVTGVSGRYITFTRADGRLTSIADAQGRSVSLTYTAGRLTAVSGVDGKTQTYLYDSAGRLTRVTSPGGVVRFAASYDGQGRAEWVEQEGTGRTTLAYDAAARKTVATLANGDVIEYRYDTLDRLVSEARGGISRHLVHNGDGIAVVQIDGVPSGPMAGYSAPATAQLRDARGDVVYSIDPTGRWEATTYNAKHRPLTTTRTDMSTVVRAYDGAGRLTTITDPAGKVWQYAFNGRGQLTSRTDPLTRARTIEYTSIGDVHRVTDEYGGVTTIGVDAFGRHTSMTDPLGHTRSATWTAWDEKATTTSARSGVTTMSYDDDRRRLSLTDPTGGITSFEYDTSGRLTAVVDPEAGRSTVEYDLIGRETARTDARGSVTRFSHTAQGWLATQTDPTGAVTTVQYDPAGREYRRIDPLGRVRQMVHDRAGRTLSLWNPDGGRTVLRYDLMGRKDGLTTPLGNLWQTNYDVAGRPVTSYDPLGKLSTASYDHIGRVLTVKDPLGVVTSTSYDDSQRRTTTSDQLGVLSIVTRDAAGQTVSQADGSGVVTAYTYDADGNQTGVTDPAGSWTYEHDLAGRRTAQVDPVGHRTTFTYDGLGRQLTQVYPDTSQRVSTYDPAGNLTKVIDQAGAEWRYAYDAADRQTTATDPLNGATTRTYDAAGQLTSITDPTQVSSHFAYDPMGRAAVAWDALGGSWRAEYDLDGRQIKALDPSGAGTTYEYDKRGLLTTQRWGTGTATGTYANYSYDYDVAGRLISSYTPYRTTLEHDIRGRVLSSTDAMNQMTTFTYDGAGRATSRKTPMGNTTTWEYDSAGRIDRAIDPLNNSTEYGYDAAGRLTSVTLPRGGVYQYSYNSLGRVTSQTDPLNAVTQYTYDGPGRPNGVTLPSGQTQTATYDSAGRLTQQTAGGQTRTFGYDAAGRLTSASGSGTSLGYAYDNRGLLTQSTDPLGQTTYGYDYNGRVTSVAPANGPASTYTYDTSRGLPASIRGATNLDFTYDRAGQLTSQTYVAPSSSSGYREYDSIGRLSSIDGAGFHAEYSYNADSLITNVCEFASYCTSGAKKTAYTYDNAGRLTSSTVTAGGSQVSSEVYAWDADGNRSSLTRDNGTPITATYDLADRLLSTSDGTTVTWDADGRQRTKGPVTYDYNPFGELVSSASAGDTITYGRDPLGRLASRSTGESYAYDSLTGGLRAAQTGIGPLTTLIRDVEGDLLASATTGATVQRAARNAHGDLVALGDDTNYSAVRWTSSYDPFGKPESATGSATVPLGYQSMLTDPANGLVDMGFRHYDPRQGSFLAPDSIVGAMAKPISFNRYLYGNADPINHFDPDGHWPDFLDDIFDAVESFLFGPSHNPHESWGEAWNRGWNEDGDATDSSDPIARFLGGAIEGLGGIVTGTIGLATADVRCVRGDQQVCDALHEAGTLDGIVQGIDASLKPVVNCLSEGDAGDCGRATVSIAGIIYGAKGVTNAYRAVSTPDFASPGTRSIGDTPTEDRSRNGIGDCATTPHSFAPATKVLMADGTTKPIGDIEIGDKVLASDPLTGETTAQPVTALHENVDADLTDVTVSTEDGGGVATLETTQHHPFWDATTKSWVDGGKLTPGDTRLIGPTGETLDVVAVRNHSGSKAMNDLTVDNVHTYYVLAGDNPVLVHNCGGSNSAHADRCLCGNGGPTRLAVRPGEVGSFGDLNARSRVGDGLTPDHIPQAASGRLDNYNDYAAVMLTDAEHALTRDFRGRGIATKRLDAGLTFREVVALKLWNYRSIGQQLYGDPSYFNESIKGVLNYYRTNFPDLGV